MACRKNYCGELLGSYRLVAECGCGPAGCVYQGRHTSSSRLPVAIKLFQNVQLSPQQCRQFLQEVRLLKKLKHPHILSILDAGFYEGFPYIISEYAAHGSLGDYLQHQSSRLPLEESLKILSHIGQALHYAHQHQVIHRNLKANNILFNASGKALLADFGLEMYGQGSRIRGMMKAPLPCAPSQGMMKQPLSSNANEAVSALVPELSGQGSHIHAMMKPPMPSSANDAAHILAPELSGQGSRIQSIIKQPLPWYAPEQAEGRIRQESDQYTMGYMAYELLIGQAPFTISDSSTMQLMQTAEPPSSHTAHTTHTERVLYKAMADQPSDRYADLLSFIAALRAATTVDATTPIVASEPDKPDEPEQDARAFQNKDDSSSAEHKERVLAQQQTVPMPFLVPAPEPASSMALIKAGHLEDEVAGAIKTNLFTKSSTGRDKQPGSHYFYLRRALIAIICIAIIAYAFGVLRAELLSAPHPVHLSQISPMPTVHLSLTPFSTPVHGPSPVPSLVPVAKQGAQPLPTPTPSPTPKLTQTPVIPPSLVVSPSSLNAESDCGRKSGWICTVTLTLAVGSQSPLNWSVSSNDINGVSFMPSSGTISTGESTVVTIYVPKTHCPAQANFIFSGSKSFISVPWNC